MKGPVRIGILGAGPWGLNLIRAFAATPRATITAICDTDVRRLTELSSAGASVTVTTLPEAVLHSRDVDAVAIATPASSHAPLALAALRAGHHVFVEKPMALSLADAAAVCAQALDRDRALMIGHVLLYHPAVIELQSRIHAGELGDIVRVHSRRLTTSSRSRHEGPWWSLAPHDVSLVRRLFAAEPAEVSAARSRTMHGAERVQASLAFSGGRIATVEVGVQERADERLVLVVGTRRSALFDDRAAAGKLVLFETRVESMREPDPFVVGFGPHRMIPVPPGEPLKLETRAFIDAILDGKAMPSDAPEGLAVTAILERGQSSLTAQGPPGQSRRSVERAAISEP